MRETMIVRRVFAAAKPIWKSAFGLALLFAFSGVLFAHDPPLLPQVAGETLFEEAEPASTAAPEEVKNKEVPAAKKEPAAAAVVPVPGNAAPEKAVWAEKVKSKELKNLYKLSKDVYRSEQPDDDGFEELEKTIGLRSVLNLREYHNDKDEAEDTRLRLYHVPLAAGKITEGQLLECLKIIHDAPKPILIHCLHGSDRTGAVSAAYRMVFQNWTAADAAREMEKGPYGFHAFYYKNLVPLIMKLDAGTLRAELFPKKAKAEAAEKNALENGDHRADTGRK